MFCFLFFWLFFFAVHFVRLQTSVMAPDSVQVKLRVVFCLKKNLYILNVHAHTRACAHVHMCTHTQTSFARMHRIT